MSVKQMESSISMKKSFEEKKKTAKQRAKPIKLFKACIFSCTIPLQLVVGLINDTTYLVFKMGEDVGLVKAPRICEMIREESEYGFNLHGEKGVIGQYISAIDTGLYFSY